MGENIESGEVLTNVIEVLDSIENKESVSVQRVQAKAIVYQARIKHSGGLLKEAEELYNEGLAMQRSVLGNESIEVSVTLSHLATVQQVCIYLAVRNTVFYLNAQCPNIHKICVLCNGVCGGIQLPCPCK